MAEKQIYFLLFNCFYDKIRRKEEDTMSFEKVQAYFETFGMGGRCINLKESSATVALAARALGTEEARIAKTLSFFLCGGNAFDYSCGRGCAD